MEQWIEGVGNEVTVCFMLLSGLLTYSVYKFISSWQPRTTFSNVAQQQSSQEAENTSSAGRSQSNTQPGSLYDLGRRGSYDEPQDGALEITVRYRESSRTVFIPESKSLLDLKRYCFQKVLDEGKRVHMVYQGHLLRPDSAPLTEFTLDNPSTFICQISQSASSGNLHNTAAGSQSDEELDLSGLLLPLLGLILFCCWMVAMSMSSSVSTNVYVGLLFLSVLYVIALVSSIT
ncbi:hypothetical protein ACHWQZ_G007125 [Mnemiopsis leidyi]